MQYKESSVTFTRPNLKQNAKFLLRNCFFNLGYKVLQQVIGIPMRSDPASFLEIYFSTIHCVKSIQIRSFFWSVFGHFSHSDYENKWIKKLKILIIGRAGCLSWLSGEIIPRSSLIRWAVSHFQLYAFLACIIIADLN